MVPLKKGLEVLRGSRWYVEVVVCRAECRTECRTECRAECRAEAVRQRADVKGAPPKGGPLKGEPRPPSPSRQPLLLDAAPAESWLDLAGVLRCNLGLSRLREVLHTTGEWPRAERRALVSMSASIGTSTTDESLHRWTGNFTPWRDPAPNGTITNYNMVLLLLLLQYSGGSPPRIPRGRRSCLLPIP